MFRGFLVTLVSYIAKGISYLIHNLPQPILNFIGDLMGLFWWDVVRLRRQVVFDNINKVFPHWTEKQRAHLARKSMKNLGRGLIEYFRLPFIDKSNYEQFFKYEGVEHLEAALKQDKGVCLLSLHTGNGDMGVFGLSLKGYPISLISKVFTISWANELWFAMRARCGANYIAPRNSTYAVLKAINRKDAVIFVLDQFMGPPVGIKVKFFGEETGASMGLTVMAKRTGAPVIPVFDIRNEDGSHTIHFLPEIPFEEKENKEKTLSHMTQVYTNCIEKIILDYPEQWMWIHRRWKIFRH
ncbi:MAG: lysophospholipid acyltransferase family protein [Bdellovibrionales bacterium]|nr:lysophospholipid acyltransferase family protein [Bdellovibrionales bacterium]